MTKLLEVNNLKVHFSQKGGLFQAKQTVYAINGINFEVNSGEILGIVGESGCGKSTLARTLCGLTPITSGSVVFNQDIELAHATRAQWRTLHQQIQLVFQDPIAALNPRLTVAEIIAEPLQTLYPELAHDQVLTQVIQTMQLVGLSPHHINRYPQEFSGGQCQRIGIARALVVKPKLLICDESVSALDVSIKAQIINLLHDLQQQLNLTIIFISHDLGIIQHLCDRILVMYLGQIMEQGPKTAIYQQPIHPYTQALLAAVPHIDHDQRQPQKLLLTGDLPSPLNPPRGCVFNTRCRYATEQCQQRPVTELYGHQLVACCQVKPNVT